MNKHSNNLNLVKVNDTNHLAETAFQYFAKLVTKLLKTQHSVRVAISGGTTPKALFDYISANDKTTRLPWKDIQLFWVDERCVSPDSDDSNYKLATDSFLKSVGMPQSNIHRIRGESNDYSRAAREYDTEIRQEFGISQDQFPVFDLIILGLGEDAHIASLFPNSCASFDTKGLVCPVYVMGPGHNRITLTVPVIQAANNIVVLIAGQKKAKIVNQVFTSEPDECIYPVHFLWPVLSKVTWMIDKDAASLIE